MFLFSSRNFSCNLNKISAGGSYSIYGSNLSTIQVEQGARLPARYHYFAISKWGSTKYEEIFVVLSDRQWGKGGQGGPGEGGGLEGWEF